MDAIHLIIQCDAFWCEMSCEEQRRLLRQLSCAVGEYRKYEGQARLWASRVNLVIAGFDEGMLQTARDLGLKNVQAWPTSASTFVADVEQRMVVLSPDAEEPLVELEAGTTYVIGGFVDRPERPGITTEFASRQQLLCRRLPITEHGRLPADLPSDFAESARVLSVNAVVVALLEKCRTGHWTSAIQQAMPKRIRDMLQQTPGQTKTR